MKIPAVQANTTRPVDPKPAAAVSAPAAVTAVAKEDLSTQSEADLVLAAAKGQAAAIRELERRRMVAEAQKPVHPDGVGKNVDLDA